MPVTLQQIAVEAGVTAATVSRVLNGRNKENRPLIAQRADRIREAAQRLGYRPNQAARSTITGRFNQVAFVTCGDLGFDWFAPQLMHGLHEALDQMGSRLSVHELAGRQLQDPERIPRVFSESAVDGMLANIDSKLPARVIDVFDEQPVPMVLLNTKRRTRCVYPDEFAGGWQAAHCLLSKGCQRPGLFIIPAAGSSPHFSQTDRMDGFAACLNHAGIASPDWEALNIDRRRSPQFGLEWAAAFIDQLGPFDGVACYGTAEASALHSVLSSHRSHTPRDVRMIVFNHQVAHAHTGIAMDTLLIPMKEVGVEAVQMIQGMITEESPRRPSANVVNYRQVYDAGTGLTSEIDDSIVVREPVSSL
ncbi:MAG: LacI family DNA-binding transcriptional regulator [Planctomycetota bacterium]